jgi:outer membrane protein OmpA-like peptidoglycan-associated protein
MSYWSHIVLFLTCCFFSNVLLSTPKSSFTTDNDGDGLSHVDYLPRYRKSNVNFLITKIEYHSKKMILHFRYIAEESKPIRFFGKKTNNAWALETPRRPGAQSLKHNAHILNIRINDRLKMRELPEGDQVTYSPEKGDIISCEIHVEKMPHFIKVVNLTGGDFDDSDDSYRFACTDLMIKGADNRTLGTEKQMETLISNFYNEFKYIRYPDIKNITSLDQEDKFAEKENKKSGGTTDTPIKNSMKPIDYMPNMLNSIQDLQCQERVILKNVYFGEDNAEFTKRIQAMRTLNVVITYLKRYPTAKIILHGHTDIFGDPYRNLVLSKQRVLTIKRVLLQKGIDTKRVITLYHGGSQPLPRYKDGGPMNRRVEVEIICKDNNVSAN